jgi:integrase
MPNNEDSAPTSPKRTVWNKGKLIGAKPPLRPKHVWSIRTKLQIQGRTRDLAMFNLAIDSKLRGCDVVALKVEDVAPNGYAVDRATVRQKKTGLPVRFEITEHTRQAVDDYIRTAGRKPGNFLFGSRCGRGGGITARQYARLVAGWIASIGLDPSRYGTHSLRRTKATLIYRRTGNWAIPKSRAPRDISASKSMTRSRWPNRLMCEPFGQSRHLLPDTSADRPLRLHCGHQVARPRTAGQCQQRR